MSETGYTRFIQPTQDLAPAAPTTPGNPASEFALPESLKRVVRQYAEDVASKVVAALAEEKMAAAFHERMRTDLAFKSAFLSRVVQYAAKHGLSEAAAAAPVLAEIVKES